MRKAIIRAVLAAWSCAATGFAATAAQDGAAPPGRVEERPFEGLRALVVQPENFWGWDSAVFGALEERGFETTYGTAELLEKPEGLSRYDIVAANIRRGFTPSQTEALKNFIASGGAFYGSWGGPMGTPALLQFCRVRSVRSVRIGEMTLAGNTPLSAGIGERRLPFPKHLGHATSERWEILSVEPMEGGIPVARDPAGNALGILAEPGAGRTAILGFGPEQEKQFADWPLGPAMTDNLLRWLLEKKLNAPRRGSGRITLCLPARAEVQRVTLAGREVKASPRTVGSVKKIDLDVGTTGEGGTVSVAVAYKPLPRGRNVETMIHLPWDTLPYAAASPAGLAEYLESLHCTVVQPLLRGGDGTAWYKGMPEDRPHDRLVKNYPGNFLADLLGECHKRGIKLIGGIYFSDGAAQKHPEATRLDRSGRPVKDGYGRVQACFNSPKGQEYNIETVRRLFVDYKIDGIILDDNFELDQNECFCGFCKEDFRTYCREKGLSYTDPSSLSGSSLQEQWIECRKKATRELASRVAKISRGHDRPAGGWVGASLKVAHLASSFDFLGGMVYTESPRASRLPLAVLGDCKFVCLLWAPDAPPELIEREGREAVHAGAPIIGYWTRDAGSACKYRMDEARAEAIRKAFTTAEAEWLKFYRASLLSGDARFAIIEGKVGRDAMTLTLKNFGRKVDRRIAGRLDLAALE